VTEVRLRDSPSGVRPGTPVALVVPSLEELAKRLRLTVSEGRDGLGPMHIAVGELGPTRFALIRHEHEPVEGTTVALLDRDVSPAEIYRVVRLLDIPQDQLTWVMDEPDARALHARYAKGIRRNPVQRLARKALIQQRDAAFAQLELLLAVVVVGISIVVYVSAGWALAALLGAAVAVASVSDLVRRWLSRG
jgi:hypothetical protein